MRLNFLFRFLLLIACLFIGPLLKAQDFAIEQVNTSAFPVISVRIKPTPPRQLERAGVGVMDHGQTVDFTLQSAQDSGKVGTARAVCFLVETSHFVSVPQLDAVKDVIEKQLRGVTDGALVNICYYSSAKGKTIVKHLSNDFTTDYATLIGNMNARMNLSGDSLPKVGCFNALLQTMDFMVGKKNLPVTKEIIFISTGNNNEAATISMTQCSQKAEENHMVVDGVGLHSYSSTAAENVKNVAQQIKGTYRSAATVGEIDNAVSGFLAQDARLRAAGALSGDTYTIRYNCPVANAGDGEVTITIGGVTRKQAYTVVAKATESSSLSGGSNWLYYGIGIGVFLLILIIGIASSRRKKKTEEVATVEERIITPPVLPKEPVKQPEALPTPVEQPKLVVVAELPVVPKPVMPLPQPQAQPSSAQQFDPHRTIISGTRLPQLTVISDGERKVYSLTQSSYTIGRNAGNGIVIGNNTVSGSHATLSLEGGMWYIADNGSTNGTFVNGRRINAKTILQPGMQVALGAVAALFE